MKTKHKSEQNHKLAKEAYESKYHSQKYENSILYGTYVEVIDKIIEKRDHDND